jgi:hypothetical protein
MKKIPKIVQLPGGVKLRGLVFQCIKYDDDGRPEIFTLMPPEVAPTPGKKDEWILFADEERIRRPL